MNALEALQEKPYDIDKYFDRVLGNKMAGYRLAVDETLLIRRVTFNYKSFNNMYSVEF